MPPCKRVNTDQVRTRLSSVGLGTALLLSAVLPATAQDGNYVNEFGGGGRRQVASVQEGAASSVHLMADQDLLLSGYTRTALGRLTPMFARLTANGGNRLGWGLSGAGITIYSESVNQGPFSVVPGRSAIDGERVISPVTVDANPSFVQAVVLDETGLYQGTTTLPGPPTPFNSSRAVAVHVDAQGRYLFLIEDRQAGGRHGIRIVRTNAALIVDNGYQPSFAPATLDLFPLAITSDANGRVYVAGVYITSDGQSYGALVLRLGTNGFADATFSGDGIVQIPPELMDEANDIALDAQGRVLLAGGRLDGLEVDRDVSVVRLLSDGSYDNSFFPVLGIGGVRVLELEDLLPGLGNADSARSIRPLPDGSMIVVGFATRPSAQFASYFAVARLLANGQLDSSFGLAGLNYGTFEQAPGLGSSDEGYANTFTPDGGLVLAGDSIAAGAGLRQFGVAKLHLAAARQDPIFADGME